MLRLLEKIRQKAASVPPEFVPVIAAATLYVPIALAVIIDASLGRLTLTTACLISMSLPFVLYVLCRFLHCLDLDLLILRAAIRVQSDLSQKPIDMNNVLLLVLILCCSLGGFLIGRLEGLLSLTALMAWTKSDTMRTLFVGGDGGGDDGDGLPIPEEGDADKPHTSVAGNNVVSLPLSAGKRS